MVVNCLSLEEWSNFMSSVVDPRDRLILDILYSTGCSEAELCEIKIKDIDFSSSTIKFKSRNSRIPQRLILNLKNFVKDSSSKYLFSSRQSTKLSTKRIQQIVSTDSKSYIKKRITPQDIRYTHINHALQRHISIVSISNQTGLSFQRLAQIIESISKTKNEIYGYEL